MCPFPELCVVLTLILRQVTKVAKGEVQEPADTPPKPSCLTGWDQSQKPTGKVSN
ncbi:hypothetical protein WJX77_011035 [Trebouxia sp. C0004]